MDLKAKMATGALTLGAGNQLINLIADLFDKWTNAHSPIFESWTIDQWQIALAVVIGALLGGPFLFFSELVRQTLVKLGRAGGYDFTKVLGNSIALVLVVCTLGCSSVPTSSEGTANAEGSQGKGGTFACAEGYTSQALPDGSAIPGSCAKGLVWTDPPTSEETTGLVKAVELIMAPFTILVEALAKLIPGGAAP